MKMKKILSIVLVMVLLASAVSLVVMPAAAISEVYEEKIPFAGEDNELTKDELVNDAILPYMLGEGGEVNLKLDDVGDAAWIYAYWDGKPKMVTDQADRTMMIYRPIERAVHLSLDGVRTFVQLGAADKIMGVPNRLECANARLPAIVHPELTELPVVGQGYVELIVSLKPDVIFGSSGYADALQEKTGIHVVCLMTHGSLDCEIYRLVGKVIGKEKEAEELILYANEKKGEITDVTSQIPDNEKPRVYMELYRNLLTPIHYDPIDLAGGINVAKDCVGGYSARISKEQIIDWNPDRIMLQRMWVKDPGSPYSKVQVEDILADPDYQTINAVKNRTVYHTIGHSAGWDPATGTVETFYMAKIFHPNKFEDLNMEKEGNEILERFYGVDGLYTAMAEGRRLHRWE